MKCYLLLCILFSAVTIIKPQEKGRYEVVGLNNDSTFINYYNEFRNSVKMDDTLKLANYIGYPFEIGTGFHKTLKLKNKKAFFKYYGKIFDKRMKDLIINSNPDSLFVNYQGIMLGNGQIWFVVLEIKNKLVIRLFTINIDDMLFK